MMYRFGGTQVPEGDWIVVIGHNPSYQIDVADMTSLLLAKPIHLYLNGHVHTLSQSSGRRLGETGRS